MADALTVDELCQRARKLLKSGRAQDALVAFEEARQMSDLDADIHEGLANTHCQLKDYEAAARHFETATRLDPRRGACWINLGAVYNRLANYPKAVEVLRRAVQIDRKSSIGFYNLGVAYKNVKQWAMAIPAYREAIRIDPTMADAHLNLGNVYLEQGNLPQAEAQYKKALEIDPGLERARRGLEKTAARRDAAKQSSSPFGRLVNLEGTPRPEETIGRELSTAERIKDRKYLFELLDQILMDVRELTDCLAGQVDPGLRTLNRLLTHQASMHGEPLTKTEALERYQEACTALSPRLRHFRRLLRQLRDHEAEVK
jgi:tetratricopeptide (TPR) repeat protein